MAKITNELEVLREIVSTFREILNFQLKYIQMYLIIIAFQHENFSGDMELLTDKLSHNEKILKDSESALISRNKTIEDQQKLNNALKDEIAVVSAQVYKAENYIKIFRSQLNLFFILVTSIPSRF